MTKDTLKAEKEALNLLIVKENEVTSQDFYEIYSMKDMFTKNGKIILERFKSNIDENEKLDLSFLETIDENYMYSVLEMDINKYVNKNIAIKGLKKRYSELLINLSLIEESSRKKKLLLSKALESLNDNVKHNNESVNIGDFATEYLKELEADKAFIKTKEWGKFNEYIKFTKGDLVIIGGRPGMAKSTLANNLFLQFIEKGYNGIFFNLEMMKGQVIARLISTETKIPLSFLTDKKKYMSLDDKSLLSINKVSEKWRRTSKEQFINLKNGSFTIEQIREEVEKAFEEGNKLEYIIVDYLHLIKTSKFIENENLKIGNISSELKSIAMEYDISVIALSQLSREVEKRADRRPMLSDLRSSGNLEQDASVVIFLYRDDYYNENSSTPNELELIISKNRNGIVGTILFDCYLSKSFVTDRSKEIDG